MTQPANFKEHLSLMVECPCFAVNDTHVQVFSSRMKIPTKLSLSLLSLTVMWGGWLYFPADGNGGKSLIFNCFPLLIPLLFGIPVRYFSEIRWRCNNCEEQIFASFSK